MGAYEVIVKRSEYGHNAKFKDETESRISVINVAGNVSDEILNNVELCQIKLHEQLRIFICFITEL
ncbi:MAG: hypothetical protein QXU18_08440 [Thermoplasmatales archaeon]